MKKSNLFINIMLGLSALFAIAGVVCLMFGQILAYVLLFSLMGATALASCIANDVQRKEK